MRWSRVKVWAVITAALAISWGPTGWAEEAGESSWSSEFDEGGFADERSSFGDAPMDPSMDPFQMPQGIQMDDGMMSEMPSAEPAKTMTEQLQRLGVTDTSGQQLGDFQHAQGSLQVPQNPTGSLQAQSTSSPGAAVSGSAVQGMSGGGAGGTWTHAMPTGGQSPVSGGLSASGQTGSGFGSPSQSRSDTRQGSMPSGSEPMGFSGGGGGVVEVRQGGGPGGGSGPSGGGGPGGGPSR